MGLSEGLSDDGSLTGRGGAVTRGLITGVATFVGGLAHALPFLISDVEHRARGRLPVVAAELVLIAWIRKRFQQVSLHQSLDPGHARRRDRGRGRDRGRTRVGRGPLPTRLACARMSGSGLVVSTLLASAVEFVEALTIVLAMGTDARLAVDAARASCRARRARGGHGDRRLRAGQLVSRAALQLDRRHAAADLRPPVAAQGDPALVGPEGAARRGGGLPRADRGGARAPAPSSGSASTGSRSSSRFKGVFLEGLEVVFIVITFGLNADSIAARRAGAAIGGRDRPGRRRSSRTGRSRGCPRTRSSSPSACCSRPSAPSGRSRGSASSPGRAASARVARRRRRAARRPGALVRCSRSCGPLLAPCGRPAAAAAAAALMRFVGGFGRFWWDFIVGDDWRIAAGVVARARVRAPVLVAATSLPGGAVAVLVAAAIFATAMAHHHPAKMMSMHGTSATGLPPGPRLPRWLQTAGFIFQPSRWIDANRRRYGDVVTFRSLFDPCFVMVFDPELAKQVFRALARAAARRRGQRRARPRRGRALGAPARRRRAPARAQAPAAALPRRAHARLRAGDDRGGRPRDRLLAGGRAVRAAAVDAVAHARRDPARGLRRGRGAAARGAQAPHPRDDRPDRLAARA